MPGTASSSDPRAAEAIGEIRGQLRELIHMSNNRSAREEATSAILIGLKDVPDRLTKIETRLEALETEKHRREGASNMAILLLKSPTLGWIVGAATTVWAFLTGRLHL